MIVSCTSGVGHGGDLVPVRSVPFLARLLTSHQRPFTIQLGCQVVEMPNVATLLSCQFRRFGVLFVEILREEMDARRTNGVLCLCYRLCHCLCHRASGNCPVDASLKIDNGIQLTRSKILILKEQSIGEQQHD